MPVRKPPQLADDELTPERQRAEEAIISRASHRTGTRAAKKPRVSRTQVLIRFEDELLARIDAAAAKRGISRQNWIQYRIAEILEEDSK